MRKILLLMSIFLMACGLQPVMAFEGLNDMRSLNIFNRINCGEGVECTRTGNGIFNMEANVVSSQVSYQVAEFEITETLAATDTVNFDMSLPVGAVVKSSYIYIEDEVVSADNNTLAISCDTAGDILAAVNLSTSTDGDFVAGAIDGDLTNNILLSELCVPEGLVGAGASGITAGKFWLVIEYLAI